MAKQDILRALHAQNEQVLNELNQILSNLGVQNIRHRGIDTDNIVNLQFTVTNPVNGDLLCESLNRAGFEPRYRDGYNLTFALQDDYERNLEELRSIADKHAIEQAMKDLAEKVKMNQNDRQQMFLRSAGHHLSLPLEIKVPEPKVSVKELVKRAHEQARLLGDGF